MDILVVGKGQMGSLHYRNLQQINDYDLQILKADYKDEFKKIINNKKIDACILALPYNLHYNFAIEALKRGIHVFVEKPISTTYDEAKNLVKFAEKKNRILMVGHILRFSKTFKIARDLINSNKIGNIHVINCRRFSNKKIKDWWKNQDRFLLLYEGIHTVDMIMHLMGQLPLSVTCKLFYSHPKLKGESEFIANLVFRSQVFAVIHHNMSSSYKINEIYISGTHGEIVIEDFSKIYLNQKLVFDYTFDEMMIESSFEEMREFINAVRYNRPPKSSAKDILPSMRVIEACYSSSNTGRTIFVKGGAQNE